MMWVLMKMVFLWISLLRSCCYIGILRPLDTFHVGYYNHTVPGQTGGSLPALSALSFTINLQLLFLNQQKNLKKNGHRIVFTKKCGRHGNGSCCGLLSSLV